MSTQVKKENTTNTRNNGDLLDRLANRWLKVMSESAIVNKIVAFTDDTFKELFRRLDGHVGKTQQSTQPVEQTTDGENQQDETVSLNKNDFLLSSVLFDRIRDALRVSVSNGVYCGTFVGGWHVSPYTNRSPADYQHNVSFITDEKIIELVSLLAEIPNFHKYNVPDSGAVFYLTVGCDIPQYLEKCFPQNNPKFIDWLDPDANFIIVSYGSSVLHHFIIPA